MQRADDEILQRLDVVGIDDLRVDPDGPHLARRGRGDLHEAVAGLAGDLGRSQLGLGGHELFLHPLRLLQDHLHVGLTWLHQCLLAPRHPAISAWPAWSQE